jgi:hypothetical protein
VVVTADALHTHADAAEFLVAGKQAHYLFCVKANQPTLGARCARLPRHNVPVLDRTGDRGHGRVQRRTLKAVTVNHVGFPHPPRPVQVTRTTHDLHASPRAVADRDRLCDPQPHLRPGQPRPARRLPPLALGNPRTACTTSATPPSPRTP